jgi:hypothetical protein
MREVTPSYGGQIGVTVPLSARFRSTLGFEWTEALVDEFPSFGGLRGGLALDLGG